MKNITLIVGCISLIAFTASSQIITTVAGSGTSGYSGDGGQASVAEFRTPNCVALDAAGNYYIGDETSNVIRMVNTTSGIISTVAGTGTGSYSGDGNQATAGTISSPIGVVLDSIGNIYIGDFGNQVVRKVTRSTGIISTIAGIGGNPGYIGDGGQATAAELNSPRYIALDRYGNVFIADAGNNRIRLVTASTGIITTIAGNGASGYAGDGGLATAAEFNYPYGVALDDSNNVYISDQYNNRVRQVSGITGVVTTIAGNGIAGYTGDGGLATAAELDGPDALTVAANGDVFISGTYEEDIRKIARSSGMISTFAGNHVAGFSGDGGTATIAEFHYPAGITIDQSGNMYVPDWGNARVRKITLAEETSVKTLTGNKTKDIAVYPNPANDLIFVSLNGVNGKVQLTLYTIQGQQLIKQEYLNQQNISLNTSQYPNGLYLLKIQKEDGTSLIKKVEIQK